MDTFNDWKRHLREVVPTLVDVHVSESNGQVSLLAEMRGGARIPVGRLSGGALNAMLLTGMSFRDQPDAMYVIESPERGIHPSVIEPLAQALNRATGPQMLLVTYSPHWVAAVPNTQLRCFVRESGALRVVQGVQLDLNDAQLKQLLPIAFSAGMV